jgi:arylsulfatase A-like enzyme
MLEIPRSVWNVLRLGGLLFVLLANQPVAARPNIIVILADDQGWGDLSCNGNTNLKTPNIDSLATSGASFNSFVVCPLCAPTRAEFLSGRYYPRTGVHDVTTGGERMNADERTLADAFKAAGYATAAFGKWHNGSQGPYHPNARGFDEFYGFCSGHWGDYFDPMLEHNGRLVRGRGFAADDFTTHALEFIDHHRDQPFFVFLALNTPHSPMQVPDKWFDRFRNDPIRLRGSGESAEDLAHTRAALAMCENIDDNVRRVLARLDELKIDRNTIVVYFTDNGPNGPRWNGGMRGIKGSLDEGGVRSPLFVRWPGTIEPGRQISQLAGAIDLFPTLLDLANVPRVGSKPVDGESLKPYLVSDARETHDRNIYSTWNGKVSVRTLRHRLDDHGRLYDLQLDPSQSRDVAREHPETTVELQRQVDQWKRDVLPLEQHDDRPFVVGYPGSVLTILPAADGRPHGGIVRSNKYPNSSYFTNWTSIDDSITWNVDVSVGGAYRAVIYYTCPRADVGATVKLRLGDRSTTAVVSQPHDPPLRGGENDRVVRQESYVKDFVPLDAGVVELPRGRALLKLSAVAVLGKQVMDFSLLTLEPVEAIEKPRTRN